jgi:hypothetical protein
MIRRLISMLAAGLLAAGTLVTTAGAASADATAARQATCMFEGTAFLSVTSSGVTYYAGTPNTTFSGATVRLKPRANGSTVWGFCFFSSTNQWLLTNRGLAMTSRSTIPGGNVTVETPGNNGNGFASQHWFITFSGSTATLQNAKTGLFLRIRNSGPIMGQTVTTGFSPTSWTLSS